MAAMFLVVDGERHPMRQPFEGSRYVLALGACPKCGIATRPTSENGHKSEFACVGGNQRVTEDDRAIEADGFCTECKAPVGTIRVEPDTLFGVREDRDVEQRCRVYR